MDAAGPEPWPLLVLLQYVCPPPCGYEITSPTVADGVVFVGTLGHSGVFYAVDAAPGNLKWKTSSMQSDVFGPPS